MSSLSNVIELSAHSKQDKPFLIIHDKNEDTAVVKVTYAQVLEKVKCLKTQVSASSVSPGPVIGIWFKDDGGQLAFVKLAVAILTAIDLKTPFIVFDPESQALPWIEESLTELKIQTLFSCNDHVGCCAQFHKISGILDLYYKPGCEKNGLPLPYKDVLYIVQTSGTTSAANGQKGKRKTVLATLGSFLPNLKDFQRHFFSRPQVVLACSPPTFDPFYLDFFCSCVSGSTLLFVPRQVKIQRDRMSKAVIENNTTFLQMTPSLWTNLKERLIPWIFSEKCPLQSVVLGGEPFPRLPAGIFASNTRFFNAYGVTEMSVWQSLVQVTSQEDKCPIFDGSGLISDTKVHLSHTKEVIVSSDLRRCIDIESGQEMAVVGTGDLGEKREDKIYHLGRSGSGKTVKINGKRTSLAEIEGAIENLCQMRCFAALSPENRVVIHLISERSSANVSTEGLMNRCIENLPSHLIPASIQILDTLPINRNGKLDVEELIVKVKPAKVPHLTYTSVSSVLSSTWQKYTGIAPSNSSNFVSDGGDSIKATLMEGECEDRLGSKLPKNFLELLLSRDYHTVTENVFKTVTSVPSTLDVKSTADSFRSAELQPPNDRFSFACKGKISGPSFDNTLPPIDSSTQLLRKWSFDLEKCIDSSPLLVSYDDGRCMAFIGSHSGIFVGVDVMAGNEIWRVQLPHRIEASAAVASDMICIGCYDGCLYALAVESGRQMWTFKTGDIIKCQPLISGDYVVFGSYDHHLYFLTLDGRLRHKINVGSNVMATPVYCLTQSKIRLAFAAAMNGRLLGVDLGPEPTGDLKLKWEANCEGPVFHALALAKGDKTVVTVNVYGVIHLRKSSCGSLLRRLETRQQTFSGITTIGGGDMIAFGNHGSQLVCVSVDEENNLSQQGLKIVSQTGPVFATPFSAILSGNETLVSLSTDGVVSLVSLKDFTVRHKFCVGDKTFSSSPVVWMGHLVLGSRNNFIDCFEFV